MAVYRYGDGWGLAHGAAADVGLDVLLGHRHHGQRGGGGQPVGLVISAGIVAHITGVAVQEGHGAEPSQAGARQTCGEGSLLNGAGVLLPRPGQVPRPHVSPRPAAAWQSSDLPGGPD